MGCAFLSPSLSSYRFYISDPQKSERPWESITNAVVVSEYGHLWRKKNTPTGHAGHGDHPVFSAKTPVTRSLECRQASFGSKEPFLHL